MILNNAPDMPTDIICIATHGPESYRSECYYACYPKIFSFTFNNNNYIIIM